MPNNLYATRANLTDEGFDTSTPSTAFWDKRIVMASEYIEGITGRWFGALARTLFIDGTGKRVLPVPIPIVQIDDIKILYESPSGASPSVDMEVDSVRVYNRHLTQGLLEPDDRDAPRLEIETFTGYPGSYLYYFPKGSQNIRLQGYFGYTTLAADVVPAETAEGSQVPANKGAIPDEINWACMKIVARLAPQISDTDAITDATRFWAVKDEKTRDQSRSYGGGSSGGIKAGALTGDSDLDTILLKYKRPVRMAMLGDTRTVSERWWA